MCIYIYIYIYTRIYIYICICIAVYIYIYIPFKIRVYYHHRHHYYLFDYAGSEEVLYQTPIVEDYPGGPSSIALHLASVSRFHMGASALQEGIRNRTEQAEPNRTEPFNFGTGRKRTRNRTGPSHEASVNAGRTASYREQTSSEPNRTDVFSKSPKPKRIEPNRFLS